MKTNLTNKQAILASALLILLLPTERGNYSGKRLVKKINRTIKKQLAIYRSTVTKEHYLKLVYLSNKALEDTLEEVKDWMDEDLIVTPTNVFNTLNYRYKDYINTFDIDGNILTELSNFNIENKVLSSVKYTNRLIKNIDLINDDLINSFDYNEYLKLRNRKI